MYHCHILEHEDLGMMGQFVVVEDATSIDESPFLLPEAPTLGQNYRNPFNPSTRIIFGLPTSTEIRLNVFDSTGPAGSNTGRRAL